MEEQIKDDVVLEAPKEEQRTEKPPSMEDYRGVSRKMTQLQESLRAKGYSSVDEVPEFRAEDGKPSPGSRSSTQGWRVMRSGTGRPLPPMREDFVNDDGEYDGEAHRSAQIKYEDAFTEWNREKDAEKTEDSLIGRVLVSEDLKKIRKVIGNDTRLKDTIRVLAHGIAGGTAGDEHVLAAAKLLVKDFGDYAESEMAELLEKAKANKKEEPAEIGAFEGARSPGKGLGESGKGESSADYYQKAAEQVAGSH